MSANPRETQFQGFAKLLFDELPWNDIDILDAANRWEERWKAHIARRAYDLVEHVVKSQAQGVDLIWKNDREWIAERMQPIPDLDKWPEDDR